MHARSIAVLDPAHSVFAVFIATISALSVPPRTQQADPPAVSAAALPAALCGITEVLSQDCESISEATK
jgi:hypothetical protein